MAFSPPYISFYSEHLMCMRAKLLQCCPNLCDPKDCSLPGSSAYGILLTRILEWVAKTSSSWMLWDPMLQDTALEANWHQVKFQLNHFLLWSLETFLNFSKLQFQKKKNDNLRILTTISLGCTEKWNDVHEGPGFKPGTLYRHVFIFVLKCLDQKKLRFSYQVRDRYV